MKKLLFFILALSLIIIFTACDAEDPAVDGTGDAAVEAVGGNNTADTGATNDPAETGSSYVDIPAFDYMGADLTQYITLGQYEGLTVTVEIETLTDEEYAAELEALLEEYAYTPYISEDRAAVEGDNLNVDFAGYIDGEAIKGTAATDTIVAIVEDSGYIPGFAEGFLGHKVGEEFSFDVTFPEDYHNSSLAGALVTFKCTINGIYDGTDPVPPSLEEFVTDFTDFETVEEFELYFRDYLDTQIRDQAMSTVYDSLWNQIIEGSTYHSLPEEEVERIYNLYKESYVLYAEMYGVDYDTFLAEYVGATDEQLYEASKSYVKEDLTLYQLMKELGVEITDEKFAEGCQAYADQAGVTVEEFLTYYDEETIWLSLAYEEVLIKISLSAEIIEE